MVQYSALTDLLETARDIYSASPARRYFAVNAAGRPVTVLSDCAVSFCALGALTLAQSRLEASGRDYRRADALLDMASARLYETDIMTLNDHGGDDAVVKVVNVFNAAIATLQEEQ